MSASPKLVKLAVVENASQTNVTGAKNWAAVRKDKAYAVLEVTTAPKNGEEEWKLVRWSGDAVEAVSGKPNQRKLSLAASKKIHVEATLGEVSDSVDLWVLWATITILTKGLRPVNAAAFDPQTRDNSDNLGPVSYKSTTSSVIDEEAGVFVDNMGASGKVAPVATLSPKGVTKVVKAGWGFERQVWSHNWFDGVKAPSTNSTWTRDTSKPNYLRLEPDADDKIYDLDAPDLRWGERSYETYNNFRQWIEWNGEKCSDFALWYWQARWALNKDPAKQITLNDLGPGNIVLPRKPHYAPAPSP